MLFPLSLRPAAGSLLLATSLMSGVCVTRAGAAESKACIAQAHELEQTKPDTQIQLNIAFFSAVGKGCLTLAKQLLAVGASVEASNRFGTTALGQAARAGKLDLVDFLLAHGAAIDARNVAGATPLCIAAESDRAAVVHELLVKGGDPNLVGSNGVSPLAAAAFNGSPAIVADLIAYRADPNTADKTGKTAILYAAAKGFMPVVQILLDAGVNSKTAYGNQLTALMWAAGYADGAGIDDAQKVVKLLVERGAALDAADNRGRTALMIAAETGHPEMVNLLLTLGANRRCATRAARVLSTSPATMRCGRSSMRSDGFRAKSR